MNQFQIFIDNGSGYTMLPETAYEGTDPYEIALPEGTQSVKLRFLSCPCILNIRQAKGDCGFPYDLSFRTKGFRLGHNLFLMEEDSGEIEAEEFRYQTKRLSISMETILLSPESAEKLVHDVSRMQSTIEELNTKWKYQIQVYDEKVKEVVRLEKDKVELNEAIEELRGEAAFWREHYQQMEHSLSWRITSPIRSASAAAKGLRKQSVIKQELKAFQEKLNDRGESDPEEKRVSIVCDVRELSEEEILSLAERIMEQSYRDLELVLMGEAGILTELSAISDRIRTVKGSSGFSDLVDKSTGSWIAPVDPYAFPDHDAVRKCMDYLREKDCDLLYTDSDFYTEQPGDARDPQYKPDYSPDYLRSCNYIRGFFAARRELYEEAELGGEELFQDHFYGLILRLCEKADPIRGGKGIGHLPEKLYLEKRQELPGVFLEKRNEAVLSELSGHLRRIQLSGTPETLDKKQGLYHIRYDLRQQPLITILIPNKDHGEDLRRCIDSVLRLSTYRNLEILIVENNSAKKETFDLYEELQKGYAARFSRIETADGGKTLTDSGDAERIPIRVVEWKEGFNFSAINNFGVPYAKGEYLLLLNNDIEVISPNWIEEMLMFAQREDVGAVGAKLYYTDDTVQHAGVIIGLGGVAAHSHLDYPRDSEGYMHRLRVAQNLSAVTAACLLMRKSVYGEVGGMDPGYQVAFNDADFCMRIRSKGYRIVFTPFAELHHDESKSRGTEDTPEKAERFESEVQRFKAEWPEILRDGDPYYNPHLTTDREDFSLKA